MCHLSNASFEQDRLLTVQEVKDRAISLRRTKDDAREQVRLLSFLVNPNLECMSVHRTQLSASGDSSFISRPFLFQLLSFSVDSIWNKIIIRRAILSFLLIHHFALFLTGTDVKTAVGICSTLLIIRTIGGCGMT